MIILTISYERPTYLVSIWKLSITYCFDQKTQKISYLAICSWNKIMKLHNCEERLQCPTLLVWQNHAFPFKIEGGSQFMVPFPPPPTTMSIYQTHRTVVLMKNIVYEIRIWIEKTRQIIGRLISRKSVHLSYNKFLQHACKCEAIIKFIKTTTLRPVGCRALRWVQPRPQTENTLRN